jgi:hypothetical protein
MTNSNTDIKKIIDRALNDYQAYVGEFETVDEKEHFIIELRKALFQYGAVREKKCLEKFYLAFNEINRVLGTSNRYIKTGGRKKMMDIIRNFNLKS